MFFPHCIYVFCLYLGKNSDLCHVHYELVGFYNQDKKCLLHCTSGVFKYSSLHFVFEGLIQEKLKDDLNKKYRTSHTKLDGSTKTRLIIFSSSSATFHPRVISKTNIVSTYEQMPTFSKGIWYGLHHKS
jgi:hypothetical protein